MSFFNKLTPRNKLNWQIKLDYFSLDITKSYFIFGSQGTGKTLLAVHFCKRYLKNLNTPSESETRYVDFIHFIDLIKMARNTFRDGEEGWQNREAINDLKRVDLLVVDDLGVEKQSDFVNETVFDLINYRYEHLKQTIITSNFNLEEIAIRYHPRIASRIAGMCILVTPKNQKDLRLSQQDDQLKA